MNFFFDKLLFYQETVENWIQNPLWLDFPLQCQANKFKLLKVLYKIKPSKSLAFNQVLIWDKTDITITVHKERMWKNCYANREVSYYVATILWLLPPPLLLLTQP